MTTVKIYPGDCRTVLASLADESVHCVVTSPPYYGLRDYKVEPSVWNAGVDCDHEWGVEGAYRVTGNNSTIRGAGEAATYSKFNPPKFAEDNARVRLVGRRDAKRDIPGGHSRGPNAYSMPEAEPTIMGSFCKKCSAWRGALGLEPTVEMYVEHMVEIFGEIRRVLRKDGTLWLNMGDSYVSTPPGNKGKFNPDTDKDGVYKRRGTRQLGHGEDMEAIYAKGKWREGSARADGKVRADGVSRRNRDGVAGSLGLKQKDLIGMPWRLALALQADGWYLRQDIIWHKPNPMPESTTDRCTKSHEYFFMLSKSARYYYDQEAIAEPVALTSVVRVSGGKFDDEEPGERDYSKNEVNSNSIFRAMKNFARHKPLASSDGFVNTFVAEPATRAPSKSGNKERKDRHEHGGVVDHPSGQSFGVPWEGWTRNKRSVWTVAVEPFPGSHFAVFPPALVRPAILAGCPQRVCATCGAPMVRQTVPTADYAKHLGEGYTEHADDMAAGRLQNRGKNRQNRMRDQSGVTTKQTLTVGWAPTCKHDADVVPGVVLDPFGGSGTVGAEAVTLDRDAVLIELSPEYVDMITARLGRPGFLAPTVEVVKPQHYRFRLTEPAGEHHASSRSRRV